AKSGLGTWRAWRLTVPPGVRCAKTGPKHWRRTGQPGDRKGKKEGIQEKQPRLPVPLLHTHVPPATRPVDPGKDYTATRKLTVESQKWTSSSASMDNYKQASVFVFVCVCVCVCVCRC